MSDRVGQAQKEDRDRAGCRKPRLFDPPGTEEDQKQRDGKDQ